MGISMKIYIINKYDKIPSAPKFIAHIKRRLSFDDFNLITLDSEKGIYFFELNNVILNVSTDNFWENINYIRAYAKNRGYFITKFELNFDKLFNQNVKKISLNTFKEIMKQYNDMEVIDEIHDKTIIVKYKDDDRIIPSD